MEAGPGAKQFCGASVRARRRTLDRRDIRRRAEVEAVEEQLECAVRRRTECRLEPEQHEAAGADLRLGGEFAAVEPLLADGPAAVEEILALEPRDLRGLDVRRLLAIEHRAV